MRTVSSFLVRLSWESLKRLWLSHLCSFKASRRLAATACGGLSRKGPYRLLCWNAWPIGSGTIRPCWNGCGFIGGSVSLCRRALRSPMLMLHLYGKQSPSAACRSRCRTLGSSSTISACMLTMLRTMMIMDQTSKTESRPQLNICLYTSCLGHVSSQQ